MDNSVTITIKDKDRDFLFELIGIQNMSAQFEEQNKRIRNQLIYKELKKTAAQSGEKLQYLVITQKQQKILEENYIKIACFDKEGKVNIAFLPEKADLIRKLIYPQEAKNKTADAHQKNALMNEQNSRKEDTCDENLSDFRKNKKL